MNASKWSDSWFWYFCRCEAINQKKTRCLLSQLVFAWGSTTKIYGKIKLLIYQVAVLWNLPVQILFLLPPQHWELIITSHPFSQPSSLSARPFNCRKRELCDWHKTIPRCLCPTLVWCQNLSRNYKHASGISSFIQAWRRSAMQIALVKVKRHSHSFTPTCGCSSVLTDYLFISTIVKSWNKLWYFRVNFLASSCSWTHRCRRSTKVQQMRLKQLISSWNIHVKCAEI